MEFCWSWGVLVLLSTACSTAARPAGCHHAPSCWSVHGWFCWRRALVRSGDRRRDSVSGAGPVRAGPEPWVQPVAPLAHSLGLLWGFFCSGAVGELQGGATLVTERRPRSRCSTQRSRHTLPWLHAGRHRWGFMGCSRLWSVYVYGLLTPQLETGQESSEQSIRGGG